ncbi:MAG: ATP-binding protein [Candidatus Vogelbacteria bacterium]|nr:ATP-binding protein [Candidatus Vogelbacteria bacterium]
MSTQKKVPKPKEVKSKSKDEDTKKYSTLEEIIKEKGGDEVLPSWFKNDLLGSRKAGISSVFILHGDTNGLFPNPDAETEADYLELNNFLSKIADSAEMAVFYDIANGARFLSPKMKDKFMELAGLKENTKAAAPANALEAAKAQLAAKKQIPREPELCLPLIEKVLKKQPKTIVVINTAHFIFPSTANGFLPPNERVNIERLKNWAMDDFIRENQSVIVAITSQLADVSSELRRAGCGVSSVFIARPDSDAREVFIATSLSANPDLKLSTGIKEFTIATQGLNLSQIREIFLRAASEAKEVDLAFIKKKKNEILNEEHGDILEIVEAQHGLEGIGGMEDKKKALRDIIADVKRGETRRIPAGITLMGPPGTGKTALVEGFAKDAEYNFVKIKNLRSKWVGESESRSERLKYALLSLAPVVVMNDESDLGGMNRDDPKGDSGVSERLMRDWMTLLSDPKIVGKIIVINCTNRVDRMDAALKRDGRSDERWLLPMPSVAELEKIFEVMFNVLEDVPTDIKDFKSFAKLVEGVSGANVRKMVKKAFTIAGRAGAKNVSDDHLKAAIADFIPNASQKEIDLMHLLGILESSSREMLPANALELVLGAIKRNLVPDLGPLIERIRENKIIPGLDAELAKLVNPELIDEPIVDVVNVETPVAVATQSEAAAKTDEKQKKEKPGRLI